MGAKWSYPHLYLSSRYACRLITSVLATRAGPRYNKLASAKSHAAVCLDLHVKGHRMKVVDAVIIELRYHKFNL